VRFDLRLHRPGLGAYRLDGCKDCGNGYSKDNRPQLKALFVGQINVSRGPYWIGAFIVGHVGARQVVAATNCR